MSIRSILALFLFLFVAFPLAAQEGEKPAELQVLKGYVGVWDAEFEVWPDGVDSPSFARMASIGYQQIWSLSIWGRR